MKVQVSVLLATIWFGVSAWAQDGTPQVIGSQNQTPIYQPGGPLSADEIDQILQPPILVAPGSGVPNTSVFPSVGALPSWAQADPVRVGVENLEQQVGTEIANLLRGGGPVTIELDNLDEEFLIDRDLLLSGAETYVLYDDDGNFLELVVVPPGLSSKDFLTAAAEWFRVIWKDDGKKILSLGDKLEWALAQVKAWACVQQPRPEQVSVSVSGELGIAVASIGGSAGATYITDELCDGPG